MHLVDVILFFHITVALMAFFMAGLMHTAQYLMRSAGSAAEVRPWATVTHRVEPLFPIVALLLFGFGSWLVHLSGGEFRFSDGWVISGIVSLGLLLAVGGGLLAPRGARLHELVEKAPEGPVEPELRAAIMNPVFWAGAHFNTGLALGVVFNMAVKPNGWQAALVVAIGATAAALIGAFGAGVLAGAPEQAPVAVTEGATP